MSIKGLVVENDVETQEADTLGGGVYTLPTGLYPMIIDMAYTETSGSGALGLKINFTQADGGKTIIRTAFWVTSGNAKGNKHYSIGQDGVKRNLPGFAMANQISQICAGKNFIDLSQEEKTIKVRDFDAKADKLVQVQAVTELLGQKLYVGLQKVRTNKVIRNSSGAFDNLAGERVFNEVHKVFYPDKFTVTEKKAEATEPLFYKKWLDANKPDYVRDDYKPVVTAGSPTSFGPTGAVATGSLFADPTDDLPM